MEVLEAPPAVGFEAKVVVPVTISQPPPPPYVEVYVDVGPEGVTVSVSVVDELVSSKLPVWIPFTPLIVVSGNVSLDVIPWGNWFADVPPPPPPGVVSPATIAMNSKNIARIEDFIFLFVSDQWMDFMGWAIYFGAGTFWNVASLMGEIFGERGGELILVMIRI
jgi:hypothetical protein